MLIFRRTLHDPKRKFGEGGTLSVEQGPIHLEDPCGRAGRRSLLLSAGVLAVAVASASCHNTWQGVKADTRKAVQKTGAGLKKAGDKLEKSVKK